MAGRALIYFSCFFQSQQDATGLHHFLCAEIALVAGKSKSNDCFSVKRAEPATTMSCLTNSRHPYSWRKYSEGANVEIFLIFWKRIILYPCLSLGSVYFWCCVQCYWRVSVHMVGERPHNKILEMTLILSFS